MIPGVSAELQAHLAQETTSMVSLWRVTRTDGEVFGFTTHVRDLEYDGTVFRARTGVSGSTAEAAANLAADNMEVAGILSADLITKEDILSGVWTDAVVEKFDVNYRDLTMGAISYPVVKLGPIKTTRGQFVASLYGLAQQFAQPLGRQYHPLCGHDLGDAKCKIDLSTFPNGIVSSTVTAVTDRRIFAASGLATPVGWSTGGKLTWTSGLNIGKSMEVLSHGASGAVTLYLPMFHAIQVSDTFDITAGCLKRMRLDCRDKFSNGRHHGGFELLPGIDKVLGGGA